jgi:hypothetical protein
VSKPIEVFKPRHGETQILVKDWPDARAPWRVRSADQRGRRLEIEGWSNFQQIVVGRLALHVQERKPLVITGYSFEDGLLVTEQPEVLGQLVLCACAVATALLDDLGVGDGCVLWQLEAKQVTEISKQFPQFEAVPRRRRLRPGKRYLRWRPS